MTPLADLIRSMAADGCSIESIAKAVEAVESRGSVTLHRYAVTLRNNAIRQARWRERKRNCDVTHNVTLGGTIGGEDSSEVKKEKKNGAVVTHVTARSGEVEEWTDADIEESFNKELWPAYPKRKGSNPKNPALTKFKALVKQGISPFDIFDGVQRLASDVRNNGTEPQFIPQMMTWLNQKRWQDGQEQTPERRSSNGHYSSA